MNKTFRNIGRIVLAASIMLPAVAFFAPTAEAICTIRQNTGLIRNYQDLPNLHQSNYAGPNDCGPTAFAMSLKWMDNNGTPGIVQDNFADTNALITELSNQLPYSERFGTWDLLTILPAANSRFYRDIKDVASRRTHEARDWGGDDDQWVNFDDIRQAMRWNNPLTLLIMWPGNEIYRGRGPMPARDSMSRHWVPMFGYQHFVLGRKICLPFGLGCSRCKDWLAIDDRFTAIRTGWIEGGNSYVYLDFDELADWYTVEIHDRI
jgi:hypothetical protein